MASGLATLTMFLPSDGFPSDGGMGVPRCLGRVLVPLHCCFASFRPLFFALGLGVEAVDRISSSSSSSGVGWRMLQEQGASSLPSSSERSSSSAPQLEVKEGMESDEEIRRVPDFGFEPAGPSTSGREAAPGAGADRAQSAAQPGQRRRGRSPADKEHRRLKRLLRNRVSAQQARERKKAYLNELEAKVKDLEARNSELEERMSTLQNENNMLRQILKNTTVSRRGPGSNGEGR